MKNRSRKTRINDEIQRELSTIIRELKDPRIPTLVSVLKVETTSDLATSKVFVSVFGSEDAQAKAMEGIQSAAGFVRKELAVRLNLRNTPELHFFRDDSIEHGSRMSQLIDQVNKAD